jgi:hypothetical protein
MTYRIVFSELAELQLADACDYYQSRQHTTLVDDFLNDFYDSIERLKINPNCRFWTEKHQGLLLNKFPYVVFFRIIEEEKTVKLVSIFNTHQNPDKYPE